VIITLAPGILQAVKELNYVILSLRKVLHDKSEHENTLRKEVVQLKRRVAESKAAYDVQSKEMKGLAETNAV
jgi:regulator of replication initiation timing